MIGDRFRIAPDLVLRPRQEGWISQPYEGGESRGNVHRLSDITDREILFFFSTPILRHTLIHTYTHSSHTTHGIAMDCTATRYEHTQYLNAILAHSKPIGARNAIGTDFFFLPRNFSYQTQSRLIFRDGYKINRKIHCY